MSYFTVRQTVDVDIDVYIHNYIDEICNEIKKDKELWHTFYQQFHTEFMQYYKEQEQLRLQFPEIEKYDFSNHELFIAIKDDGSYLIINNVKIFFKEKQSTDLCEWKQYVKKGFVAWNGEELINQMLPLCNKITSCTEDGKQFIKTEGDFIIKYKSIQID